MRTAAWTPLSVAVSTRRAARPLRPGLLGFLARPLGRLLLGVDLARGPRFAKPHVPRSRAGSRADAYAACAHASEQLRMHARSRGCMRVWTHGRNAHASNLNLSLLVLSCRGALSGARVDESGSRRVAGQRIGPQSTKSGLESGIYRCIAWQRLG